MKRNIRFLIFALLILSFALVLTNCGGSSGGGGGGGGGGGSCASPTVDATGTWRIADTSTNNNCGDPLDTTPYDYVITQSGNSITAQTPVGNFSGQICGNRVNWTGSWPEGSGNVTSTITFTVSGNTVSGTSVWIYTEPGWGSCSGTNTFAGVKL